MTTSQNRPATSEKATTKSTPSSNNDLETEMPLSEKDEVKKAERKTTKAAKK